MVKIKNPNKNASRINKQFEELVTTLKTKGVITSQDETKIKDKFKK